MRKLCFFFLLWMTSALYSADYLQHVAEVRSIFAEQMFRDYGLICYGTMDQMPDDIEMIGLKLKAYRRANIEEARALEVIATNKLLGIINEHEKIRPYLREYPFPPERVCLTFSFDHPKTKRSQSDGSISFVSHIGYTVDAKNPNQNKLLYKRQDAFNDKIIKLYSEPYDEAEALVEASGLEHPPEHHDTEQEKALDAFFEMAEKELKRKHRIQVWSLGCDQTDKIGEIHAIFTSLNPANEEKGRLLGVSVVESLLELINNDETLKPYLKRTPFTSECVKLRINFRDRKNYLFYDGVLDSVIFEAGQVTYLECPPEKEMFSGSTVIAQESYEEALKKTLIKK